MEEQLPFKCEYAKSGRASCKGCKITIGKETLRLAIMVQVNKKCIILFLQLTVCKQLSTPYCGVIYVSRSMMCFAANFYRNYQN